MQPYSHALSDVVKRMNAALVPSLFTPEVVFIGDGAMDAVFYRYPLPPPSIKQHPKRATPERDKR